MAAPKKYSSNFWVFILAYLVQLPIALFFVFSTFEANGWDFVSVFCVYSLFFSLPSFGIIVLFRETRDKVYARNTPGSWKKVHLIISAITIVHVIAMVGFKLLYPYKIMSVGYMAGFIFYPYVIGSLMYSIAFTLLRRLLQK